MKKAIILLIITVSFSTFARRGQPETEADYIVPTAPQYVAFSRFKVQIIDRFEGPQTQKISYIFPEFLVGKKDQLITLTRITNTENSWTSPQIDASCTVFDGDFSCNIRVKKPSLESLLKNNDLDLLKRETALQNLPNLNLTAEQLKGYEGVINAFYSHEPAGFLFYDID